MDILEKFKISYYFMTSNYWQPIIVNKVYMTFSTVLYKYIYDVFYSFIFDVIQIITSYFKYCNNLNQLLKQLKVLNESNYKNLSNYHL